MIGKLLKKHGIDYVINVDDCYSIKNDIGSVKATIFGILKKSPEEIIPQINKINKGDLWNQFKEFINPEENNDSVLMSFMEELGDDNLLSIYNMIDDEYRNSDFQEKNRLLAFLKKLLDEKYIKNYLTYSSTKEAMQKYSQDSEDASGILWLIDKDFSRVDEGSEAGLTLAQNIIDTEQAKANYVFILSSIDKDSGKSEDVIEKEFDEKLKENNLKNASFIYYLYKQRIDSNHMDRIAKSLASGFKRKTCYQIFAKFAECLKEGIDNTENNLCDIKQDTLQFLFSKRVPEEGESIWEFLMRFVDLFMRDEYKNALVNNYDELVDYINHYTDIDKISPSLLGDEKMARNRANSFRKMELYDNHVNELHSEVTTGDIFKIHDNYYILISQACDSCLREEGERVLRNATLLQIGDAVTKDLDQFKYELNVSFVDELSNPKVDFKQVLTIPFELLDLCVLNRDGKSLLPLGKENGKLLERKVLYEERFKKRMEFVNSNINEIVKYDRLIESFFRGGKDISVEEIRKAYTKNRNINPELVNYSVEKSGDEEVCEYSVQRICRLQEIKAIDIIRKYGNNVSRIGHDFDFSAKLNRKNRK